MANVAIAPVSAEADRRDGALVEAHLDGEPRAFEVLYRRHQERLVRFCWKQTHDLPLAEDLAQEAMIRYLQKAETFDTSQPMWPWLKTIARNLVIDHFRRTSNEPHLDPDLGSAEDGSTACTIRLDRIAERSHLAAVLAELPKRQRVALRLHHAEDWTTADVADYFDIKVNACKQLLYRARKNARKYYEELADGANRAFSVIAAHPLVLALRERCQRSRGRLGAVTTDMAGMTAALDAAAEHVVAALAVVATIAMGGMDVSVVVHAATATSTDANPPASPLSAGSSTAGPPPAGSAERAARPPARPARDTVQERYARAEFAKSERADVDGVTSISGTVSYERSDDEVVVHEEITVDLGPHSPVHETTVTIPCDGPGITYNAACTAVETADDLVPEDPT